MAAGMITRHYEHPDGATATLEMPAGYSRNCFYVLSVKNWDGTLQEPQTRTFPTPEDARQGAIARERHAMGDGWRPKIVARAAAHSSEQFSLHRPTGARLDLQISDVEITSDKSFHYTEHGGLRTRIEPSVEYNMRARAINDSSRGLQPGERYLFRTVLDGGESIAALILNRATMLYEPMSEFSPHITYDLRFVQTVLEGDEKIAIARWGDREQVVIDLIDWPGGMQGLWEEISRRVQDTSLRQQVQQEILGRRALREQEAARQRQADADRAREEARAAVAMIESTRAPRERPTPRPILVDDAMRKLSGGEDLNQTKKRKIKLGE